MANPLTLNIKLLQKRTEAYANGVFPQMAARKGLRFIDDNFRNQSWAGLPNIPFHRRSKNTWGAANKKGRAILVKTGDYRRSWRANARPGEAILYSNVKYAKVHNEGFNGQVNQSVREHQRRLKKLAKTVTVSAHNRTIEQHIPRRQVAPTAARPSSVLTNDVKRQVTLDLLKLLKGK